MNGLVKHRSRVEGLILFLREERVLLDADLATIYGVSTKALNQAVKRNGERFPIDFRFQLSDVEKQEVVTKCGHLARLKYSKARPYAFTEHGALMVANVRGDCSRKAPTRVGVETRFAWNSEIRPYFVPRWRDFEGFSLRCEGFKKKSFKGAQLFGF